MSQNPPSRSRPLLHLNLTALPGSPLNPSHETPFQTPAGSPYTSVRTTPLLNRSLPSLISSGSSNHSEHSTASTTPCPTLLGSTNHSPSYSPFRSAGLKPPKRQGSSARFTPRRTKIRYSGLVWVKVKRVLRSRLLWFISTIVWLVWWWSNGGRQELETVKVMSSDFGKDLFTPEMTKDLQFFPANNPKIHYIGRWTATPNRLRKDGTFPGVYFDITMSNTTTLLLSLYNAPEQAQKTTESSYSAAAAPTTLPNPNHLSFRPSLLGDKPALPISLLARIDQEEYILLPNSSALVSIRSHDLDSRSEHNVRVVAPMTDDHGRGTIELEGIWLSKGGLLKRVEGSLLDEVYDDEDLLQAENGRVGEKHRLGLLEMMRGNGRRERVADDFEGKDHDGPNMLIERKKILEIITDNSGSLSGKGNGKRTGGADGLLAGVMGWDYLLGEMFGVDRVGVSVDGMCLSQECIGGVGAPSGIGDVFFRSGPPGSTYFDRPWMFQAYVPDVLVLNLGGSDHLSFSTYASDYKQTAWEFSNTFEETYVSLIRAIRQLAYPHHPSTVYSERYRSSDPGPDTAPASIPIFVMRPLRGQLELATQNVVRKIRDDGDKSVFWLDTSGWLDVDESLDTAEIDYAGSRDFFLDETVTPKKWRLTEQGNQRVAIFMHMHVCRYLARKEEKCAFLPPEVYQGKVFDPMEAGFESIVEEAKERKLKELFWGG